VGQRSAGVSSYHIRGSGGWLLGKSRWVEDLQRAQPGLGWIWGFLAEKDSSEPALGRDRPWSQAIVGEL